MSIDIKKMADATLQLGKSVLSNKKVQVTLYSIPLLGWIGSEIQRKVDNQNHQKQIALYQEAIRKHQAEIDILKNDKDREEYKQKLWAMILENSVEG